MLPLIIKLDWFCIYSKVSVLLLLFAYIFINYITTLVLLLLCACIFINYITTLVLLLLCANIFNNYITKKSIIFIYSKSQTMLRNLCIVLAQCLS